MNDVYSHNMNDGNTNGLLTNWCMHDESSVKIRPLILRKDVLDERCL